MLRDSLHRSSSRRTRAFTLVEIMVVVVIIGLLAAMGLPTYRHITLRSKATAVVTDLRAYSAVLVNYNLSKGAWPTASQPGVVPPEVADAMQSGYTRPSPIGGYYEFDADNSANGFHVTSAITIATANGSNLTDDLELLELIDQLIDDGNLATGNVRLGSTNNLVYIIEQ
jgi:prepilin-type N-terminal cleavage/methylation domain-containing protein